MTSLIAASPALARDSLARFLQEIRAFPLLSRDEEHMLAKRWREHGDREAAHKLVTSHLRLVAKIAAGYRGYGLPFAELVSEGNVGLMQAVKRFDPDRGFRLSTYAVWWIRASIKEYVLHSWSLVKMGTMAAQKKLFFGLRTIKGRLKAIDAGDMSPEMVKTVARELAVPNPTLSTWTGASPGATARSMRPRAKTAAQHGRIAWRTSAPIRKPRSEQPRNWTSGAICCRAPLRVSALANATSSPSGGSAIRPRHSRNWGASTASRASASARSRRAHLRRSRTASRSPFPIGA